MPFRCRFFRLERHAGQEMVLQIRGGCISRRLIRLVGYDFDPQYAVPLGLTVRILYERGGFAGHHSLVAGHRPCSSGRSRRIPYGPDSEEQR